MKSAAVDADEHPVFLIDGGVLWRDDLGHRSMVGASATRECRTETPHRVGNRLPDRFGLDPPDLLSFELQPTKFGLENKILINGQVPWQLVSGISVDFASQVLEKDIRQHGCIGLIG